MKHFGLRANPALAAALAIFLLAGATIGGAFVFQAFGYAPCELCLKERLPYYAGLVLSAVAVGLAERGPRSSTQRSLLRAGFLALVLIFAAGAGLGAYHAGVEWGFWPGPTDCTGMFQKAGSMQEFLKQLHATKVVRCDAVAIRILGLSLAGWNAVISIVLAALAIFGLREATLIR